MSASKSAVTAVPIHALMAERWSPRSFAPEGVKERDQLALFEAARWSASCFNGQPWRFLLADRDRDPDFHRALGETLMEGNAWARRAPLLIAVLSQDAFEHNGKPNAHAWHDVGQAVGQLVLQAEALGLVTHQMAGILAPELSQLCELPEGYRPVSVIAVGKRGDAQELAPELLAKEQAVRARKPLSELVFRGAFGTAAELSGEES